MAAFSSRAASVSSRTAGPPSRVASTKPTTAAVTPAIPAATPSRTPAGPVNSVANSSALKTLIAAFTPTIAVPMTPNAAAPAMIPFASAGFSMLK